MAGVNTIARVVIGSRLHGLQTPDSDYDKAEVIVSPLRDLLSPYKEQKTKFIEEVETDPPTQLVHYELIHFCKLLTSGNPTILEVLWSNIIDDCVYSWDYLFENKDRILDSTRIYKAHRGYAHDQLRRMQQRNNYARTEEEWRRAGKAAAAALRVLGQGIDLLTTGTFSPQVRSRYEDHPDARNVPLFMLELKSIPLFDLGKRESLLERAWDLIGAYQTYLDTAYNHRTLDFHADLAFVEDYIYKVYTGKEL